jgi:uncharacterized membrane protein YhaH (DUF805 family)
MLVIVKKTQHMKYYILAIKRIFDFKGESTIKEFWYFFLFNIIISLLLIFLCKKIIKNDLISEIHKWFSLIPLYSVGFRRIRNTGLSPWLFLIPVINIILAGFPEKEVKEN